MHQVRNFVMRLSVHYILLSLLLLLRGISRDQQLFGVWIAALVFTILTVTVRRVLLTLTLPLIIMSGGLFVFVLDGLVLVMTAALTRLNINNFWWALLGVIVMSMANIWIERALRALGWFWEAEPREKNVMTRRSPSVLTRLILLALLLFGVVYSAAMAGQLFAVVSTLTTHIPTVMAVTCIAFALFVAGIAWLVAEGLAVSRRARFSLVTVLIASAVVAAPAAALILTAELPLPAPLPEPMPGTAHWELPTGSRIAFRAFPSGATGDGERNPIVFLHDFGQVVLEADAVFFSRFNEAGFDVYLYDQVGSGRSGWLDEIEQYTVSRHVRDLEMIRTAIRADRLIFIGHAGGAELAARYMVAHPNRVERVVFYGPTPLWDDDQFALEEVRTAASPVIALAPSDVPPRVAVAVAAYSPRTAQRYVPQASIVTWSNEVVDLGRLVCLGSEAPPAPEPAAGYNLYAATVARVSANRAPDPRPALGLLPIPALLIRGTCDPVEETVVAQYEATLPLLRTTLIEGAGSLPHLSQPDAVWDALLAFLE
jgi:pimeloyl-ACP methyl ester carboxylesterase/uncharacterized membrane protein YvlD (DUF360 family)